MDYRFFVHDSFHCLIIFFNKLLLLSHLLQCFDSSLKCYVQFGPIFLPWMCFCWTQKLMSFSFMKSWIIYLMISVIYFLQPFFLIYLPFGFWTSWFKIKALFPICPFWSLSFVSSDFWLSVLRKETPKSWFKALHWWVASDNGEPHCRSAGRVVSLGKLEYGWL